MNLILIPNIWYELLVETTDQKCVSTFFMSSAFLTSRQNVLNAFMQILLDQSKCEECLATVYARHTPSGERIELLNTATFDVPGDNLPSLEKEVYLYQMENVATHIGIWDHKKPNLINLLWSRNRMVQLWKRPNNSLLLAHNYWIFLRKKKEKFLIP